MKDLYDLVNTGLIALNYYSNKDSPQYAAKLEGLRTFVHHFTIGEFNSMHTPYKHHNYYPVLAEAYMLLQMPEELKKLVAKSSSIFNVMRMVMYSKNSNCPKYVADLIHSKNLIEAMKIAKD